MYGLLSLGLVLVVARRLSGDRAWKDLPLQIGFWGMNAGLALDDRAEPAAGRHRATWASVETGLWYARSAEFLQLPWIVVLLDAHGR